MSERKDENAYINDLLQRLKISVENYENEKQSKDLSPDDAAPAGANPKTAEEAASR